MSKKQLLELEVVAYRPGDNPKLISISQILFYEDRWEPAIVIYNEDPGVEMLEYWEILDQIRFVCDESTLEVFLHGCVSVICELLSLEPHNPDYGQHMGDELERTFTFRFEKAKILILAEQ